MDYLGGSLDKYGTGDVVVLPLTCEYSYSEQAQSSAEQAQCEADKNGFKYATADIPNTFNYFGIQLSRYDSATMKLIGNTAASSDDDVKWTTEEWVPGLGGAAGSFWCVNPTDGTKDTHSGYELEAPTLGECSHKFETGADGVAKLMRAADYDSTRFTEYLEFDITKIYRVREITGPNHYLKWTNALILDYTHEPPKKGEPYAAIYACPDSAELSNNTTPYGDYSNCVKTTAEVDYTATLLRHDDSGVPNYSTHLLNYYWRDPYISSAFKLHKVDSLTGQPLARIKFTLKRLNDNSDTSMTDTSENAQDFVLTAPDYIECIDETDNSGDLTFGWNNYYSKQNPDASHDQDFRVRFVPGDYELEETVPDGYYAEHSKWHVKLAAAADENSSWYASQQPETASAFDQRYPESDRTSLATVHDPNSDKACSKFA
ncbi:MAG: hypothetical protein LBP35_05505 [Candidatus Ancillula trichonymphae]|nr:hypothetical protein [Candidatus Ancillula trichonymphae]